MPGEESRGSDHQVDRLPPLEWPAAFGDDVVSAARGPGRHRYRRALGAGPTGYLRHLEWRRQPAAQGARGCRATPESAPIRRGHATHGGAPPDGAAVCLI